MNIIFTPSDLPKGIKFKILSLGETKTRWQKLKNKLQKKKKLKKNADNDTSALHLQDILKKYCPTSECMGIQKDAFFEKNKYPLIIFQPDIHTIYNELLNAGWKQEKLILMPIPISDHWSYWNFDPHIFVKADGSTDLEKCMNNKNFLQDLHDRKMIVPDKNSFNPIYPNKSGLTWRTELGVEGGSATHLYPYPLMDNSVQQNLERINRIIDSLSNEKSKSIYKEILLGSPYNLIENYFNNTPKNLQYFEYLNVRPGQTILNCGVDTGFEIPFLCTLMEGKGNVYNLDPEGFDKLHPYCRDFAKQHIDILHENRFYIGGDISEKYLSRKDFSFSDHFREDTEKVSLITLDHFVKENDINKVDIIKMDIEGAEWPATPAMMDTIKRFRPQLAVAVYHGAHHFWDIPEMLIENCHDYDFYFNIYSYAHFEGIFYAIPKEQNKECN